jgi:hypothetical protein
MLRTGQYALNRNDKHVDDYYSRREWMLRVRNCFVPATGFDAFSRECFSVVMLKNQIKRYLINRRIGRVGVAAKVVESELDYCQVMLSTLLTNSYAVSMRELAQRVNRKRTDSIVEVEKRRRSN